MCRTKSVREVTKTSIPHQTSFLGSISCGESEPAWTKTVAIQRGLIDFKLDSGADITIISEATLNEMKPKPKLKPVYTKSTSPGGQLSYVGQFMARSITDGPTLHYLVILVNTTDNLHSREDGFHEIQDVQLICRTTSANSTVTQFETSPSNTTRCVLSVSHFLSSRLCNLWAFNLSSIFFMRHFVESCLKI